MPRLHEKQLTIGQMVARLARVLRDDSIHFDFCDLYCDGAGSYRGFYEDVALGWTEDPKKALNAGQLHDDLARRVGRTQEGYKGGTFDVNAETALWVSNYGMSSSTAVVGILDRGYGRLLIETTHVDC